eukprot:322277-Chlamydomonas_euryale.AAC.4
MAASACVCNAHNSTAVQPHHHTAIALHACSSALCAVARGSRMPPGRPELCKKAVLKGDGQEL